MEKELTVVPELPIEERYKELEAAYLEAMEEIVDWRTGRKNIKSIVLPESPTLLQYNAIIDWLKKKRVEFINAQVGPKKINNGKEKA